MLFLNNTWREIKEMTPLGLFIFLIWLWLIIAVIIKRISDEREASKKADQKTSKLKHENISKSDAHLQKEKGDHFYPETISHTPPTPLKEKKDFCKKSIETENNTTLKYYQRGSVPSYSGPTSQLQSNKSQNAIEKSIRHHEEKEKASHKGPVKIHYNDFVVRSNIFHCLHKDHKVRDIEAIITVFTKSGDTMDVTVSAGYCENCRLYFIMESVFKKVTAIGNPLCLIVEYKKYANKNHYYENRLDELSPQSRLNMCGYNVSKHNGLTALERQKILAGMVDNGIATRQEILSYLQYFIHMRETREQYKNAIDKWEEDIDFISNYRIGSYGAKRVGSVKISK